MLVHEKTRDALDVESLRASFPASISVLKLEATDYVDSTGEPSLRVLVVIDEGTDVENVPGRDVGELKSVIRERLRDHGIQVFLYFTLAKPSELERPLAFLMKDCRFRSDLPPGTIVSITHPVATRLSEVGWHDVRLPTWD